MTPAEKQAASLLDAGYTEVAQLGRLRVGGRVRHIGQQYTEARKGTATIERIFHRPGRYDGDIELIVRRDKPEWGSDYGYWARYHTVVI